MRIIPKQGVCDPHIHIFNGKAYMFSTHDRSPANEGFRMDDWRIFSSDDLLNWTLDYTFRPEDTFLGTCDECYATDAAERNGKYYLYFSKGQQCTGVAVSDTGPAGPYKDALGRPLLPEGLADTASYDPAVFIDDDEEKTPYILWGYTCNGKKYYIARLNEDMTSLAEEPRPIEIENTWSGNDAVCLTKRNGIYYLSSHRSFYATSENIYGPYTYRGMFCEEAYVDHGTFFNYHNQTYFTYGVPENWGEPDMNRYYRTTKMMYAHYRANGEIVIDEFIQKMGVGHYDASWDIIKGEWYFAASDGIVKTENGTGFDIRGIRDGSYLYYPNVSGMVQNARIRLHAVNPSGRPCIVEIREDSPFGHVLGCCPVGWTGTQDELAEIPCCLENTFGTHDLCFVFRGEGENLLHFDGFRFEQIRP